MNSSRSQRQKSTPQKPISPDSKKPDDSLRAFSQWLLLIPLVIFILFLCGQLSILTGKRIANASTGSKLSAEYEPWYSVFIRPINPEIVEEVISDRTQEAQVGNTEGPGETSGQPWVDPTSQPTLVAAANPTVIALLTSQPTGASATLTSVRQPTNTPVVPAPSATTLISPTPAPTATVLFSPTPAHTSTIPAPTQPAASTATQSPPSDSGTATYWLSSSRQSNLYQLVQAKPNGVDGSGGISVIFTTDPFSSGTKLKGGKVNLYFYAQNLQDHNMEIGFFISIGPGIDRTLGGGTSSIPANTTTPTLFTRSFSILAYEFSEGETLQLRFFPGVTSIHWDGPWNDARIILPPITP